MVVGAPNATVGAVFHTGAAYVFAEPGSGWANTTQTAKLTASNGAEDDWFGNSVSISGNTAVVGAYYAQPAGAAYVFTEPASGWANTTQTAKLTVFDAADADLQRIRVDQRQHGGGRRAPYPRSAPPPGKGQPIRSPSPPPVGPT